MEIILNIAWAVCSLALIWCWIRNTASNPVPRRMQMLALAMVVLLLLPVISLSDDLMAAQGPAESDTCMRRALHSDDTHPSAVPASLALPEEIITALMLSGPSQDTLETEGLMPPSTLLIRSLDSRPPPRV